MEITFFSSETKQILLSAFKIVLLLAILWIIGWQIDVMFPFIKPGSDVIYDAKDKYLISHAVFEQDKPIKILVIGNSKVLSGFIPDQFNREVQGSTSFNAGFPNTNIFKLEEWLEHGNIPTIVFYMVQWEDLPQKQRTFFHYLPKDVEIIDFLFPFHNTLRNAMVFMMRSPHFGGVIQSYQHSQKQVEKMYHDKGYFFIEDQSHYPTHELPKDFRLISDNGKLVEYRDAKIESQAFQDLKKLSDKYHFEVWIMPYYLREGERGVPGVNNKMKQTLSQYFQFHVVGDEYYLFENRYFSDIAHLNPTGAQLYTHLIAELTKENLKKHAF